MPAPTKLENAVVTLKANIYFEGKVVSHTMEFPGGVRKTVGLIYPGSYTFNTGVSERMDMVAGACRVRLAGASEWKTYAAGSFFEVPGHSVFDIAVDSGISEYLCSYGA